jgi:hypothetical protein
MLLLVQRNASRKDRERKLHINLSETQVGKKCLRKCYAELINMMTREFKEVYL